MRIVPTAARGSVELPSSHDTTADEQGSAEGPEHRRLDHADADNLALGSSIRIKSAIRLVIVPVTPVVVTPERGSIRLDARV
jgi:hypothetical protein